MVAGFFNVIWNMFLHNLSLLMWKPLPKGVFSINSYKYFIPTLWSRAASPSGRKARERSPERSSIPCEFCRQPVNKLSNLVCLVKKKKNFSILVSYAIGFHPLRRNITVIPSITYKYPHTSQVLFNLKTDNQLWLNLTLVM